MWGRGQEKSRRHRLCPPGEKTRGTLGSSGAIRGGHGEDAYPGRRVLLVATGPLPNPLCLGQLRGDGRAYPFTFFTQREPFN